MKSKPCRYFGILIHLTFLVPALIAVQSCSTTRPATQITATWKDPEAKTYQDFFVAVLSKNLPARSTLERDIASRLKDEKVKVAQSLDTFSHSEKIETAEEKKAAVEKIQGLGHDAIITVTLIKKTEEERYVPGNNSYTPTNIGYGTGYHDPMTGGVPGPGAYGSFGVYYASASTAYTTPGYYEMDKAYFLETRLYDAKTSRLVWSGQSETFNPGDLKSASSDFSTIMVQAMKKSGLIRVDEKKK